MASFILNMRPAKTREVVAPVKPIDSYANTEDAVLEIGKLLKCCLEAAAKSCAGSADATEPNDWTGVRIA